MKKLVILGAGTAGTMMLNKFNGTLDKREWQITIVDQHDTHYYQPGFLFIPFDIYTKKDVIKPKRDFFPIGTNVIMSEIQKIEPENNRVILTNNAVLPYDYLIIATGAKIKPEQTEGMMGDLWRKNIFDFYTIEGACALREFFKHWQGGKLVINITEMPIIISKGSLEGVYPGLIMANGARMEGIEASLFFTFFGLYAVINKKMDKLKVATVGNPAMCVPSAMGPGLPTWMGAIPGMSWFATNMMKKEIEKLDIPPVREFIEMIHNAGCKIYGCKATVDMFHLTMKDFCPQVDEVISVGQFYEKSAGASIIFT